MKGIKKRVDKQLINCGILRDQRKYWLLGEIPQNTSKNPGGASRRRDAGSHYELYQTFKKIQEEKGLVWWLIN